MNMNTNPSCIFFQGDRETARPRAIFQGDRKGRPYNTRIIPVSPYMVGATVRVALAIRVKLLAKGVVPA